MADENEWTFLGSDTLASAGKPDVTFTTKKLLQVLVYHIKDVSNGDTDVRFNNNSNSVYARRHSYNGGTDATNLSVAEFDLYDGGDGFDKFAVMDIMNITGQEKLIISHTVSNGTSGAGNFPLRLEMSGKFVPSPDADITQITARSTNNWGVDSGIDVAGAD